MSFEWNFSDDEGSDFEEFAVHKQTNNHEEKDKTREPSLTRMAITPSPFASLKTGEIKDDESDDHDDEESVDWEDGLGVDDDDERKPAAAKTPTTTLRPVQVDLDDYTDRKEAPKRKRRRKYRIQSLPEYIQTVLWNLHQSHLLALSSSAIHTSNECCRIEVVAVAYSLFLDQFTTTLSTQQNPTLQTLHEFLQWYCNLICCTRQRRLLRRRANIAAGAPRRIRQDIQQRETIDDPLLNYCSYLSSTNDADPQIVAASSNEKSNDTLKTQLFVAMARSLGWRTRFVQHLDPVSPDLDEDHPILEHHGGLLFGKRKKKKVKMDESSKPSPTSTIDTSVLRSESSSWIEILCSDSSAKHQYRWVHVDPIHQLLDQPDQVESLVLKTVSSYILAVEHNPEQYLRRLTDVTPRYSSNWIASLRKRGLVRSKNDCMDETVRNSWWTKTLHSLNHHDCKQQNTCTTREDAILVLDDDDDDKPAAAMDTAVETAEQQELQNVQETMPTSKAAFRTHPVYVIPSVLGKAEVLARDAKVCGVFKGQMVYKRSCVSAAFPAQKWLYRGRKVKAHELEQPIKRVKKRKNPSKAGFQALKSYGMGTTNDGSAERRQQDIQQATAPLDNDERLYAIWQTESWSPAPVGPNDAIPVSEYGNVELELLNPGLVHLNKKGLAKICQKLGIPYAPCLLGFEGRGGNRVPAIRGIVVHEHNKRLVREAAAEVRDYTAHQEMESRRQTILLRWKRLMVGLLTKERLEREYGDK